MKYFYCCYYLFNLVIINYLLNIIQAPRRADKHKEQQNKEIDLEKVKTNGEKHHAEKAPLIPPEGNDKN
jgi:hypothetical protein